MLENLVNLSNFVKKGENYWKYQKFPAFNFKAAFSFEVDLWKKLTKEEQIDKMQQNPITVGTEDFLNWIIWAWSEELESQNKYKTTTLWASQDS